MHLKRVNRVDKQRIRIDFRLGLQLNLVHSTKPQITKIVRFSANFPNRMLAIVEPNAFLGDTAATERQHSIRTFAKYVRYGQEHWASTFA